MGQAESKKSGRKSSVMLRSKSTQSEKRQYGIIQSKSSDSESRQSERRDSESRQSEINSNSESMRSERRDSESRQSERNSNSESRQSERRDSESWISERNSDSESRQSERRDSESKQSESHDAASKESKSKIIAAIDFGTSFTGFAYAFNGNVDQIFTGKHGNALKDDRVPTVLLLTPNEDFHSFGTDAEDQYARLVLRQKHHEYRLFRQFKMAVYTQKDTLNKELTINDTLGRPKRALDIFSIIIKHLKELILKSMEGSICGDTSMFESETQWLLTIPAIWSDSARQFMREAAMQGGIPEKNLRLVLEPEAAALFCKNELLEATNNVELRKLPPGTKYIMADLGGGTVDICSHEILENEKIRELYRVQGGAYGGSSVNNYFIQFLIKLFAADILKKFERHKMIDYLRIMREFEENKKKFDNQNTTELFIDIPQSLIGMLKRDTGCTLEELVANTSFSKRVEVNDNHLLCDEKIMESFFKFSVDGIFQTLREIISHCEKDEIDILLLVGGYAESQYIREVIKKEIDPIKAVLVQEPRLAVLKGAIYMGLKPRDIIERRARYTYGFSVARSFKEGIHPEALKFIMDGEENCSNIFSKVIEKNQILTFNQEFNVNTSTTLRQPDSKRLVFIVALYRTDKHVEEYCLETENCQHVGEIVVKPPVGGWPNYVDIDNILIVGETEFTVKAIDRLSGREYKAYVDFL